MSNPDDKHGDHDLKAYFDGRDGVSAAYSQAAHDEPPAALDRLILDAARKELDPLPATWHAGRKPYALAASVMVAVVALSVYFGGLDKVVLQPEPAALAPNEANTVEIRLERTAEPLQPAADDAAPPAVDAAAAEEFARTIDAPAVVIDGPLLQQIEAEAEAARARTFAPRPQDSAAQAQGAGTLEEAIVVTGSRVLRRDDTAYRASREEWLVAMRAMVVELQRSSRLTVAQRSTAVLGSELEAEIELFLEQYPDTDIDAELGLTR